MAFAKKTWKDRIAEFPTRRRLTKEDNTSELVTVAREEGTLSQEGDAFSAENMNDLESRIDAEFTEVNGKLNNFCQFYNSTGTLGVALKEYSVNFVLKSPFILIVGASTGSYLVFGYCGTSGYYAGIATEMTGSNKLFTFYANDRGNTPSFSEK